VTKVPVSLNMKRLHFSSSNSAKESADRREDLSLAAAQIQMTGFAECPCRVVRQTLKVLKL